MDRIHGRVRFRNSSKNTRQNLLSGEKLRTVLPSFTTRDPIAASGMNTPVKPLAWVCSAKPPSRRFPRSSRKPGISNLDEESTPSGRGLSDFGYENTVGSKRRSRDSGKPRSLSDLKAELNDSLLI